MYIFFSFNLIHITVFLKNLTLHKMNNNNIEFTVLKIFAKEYSDEIYSISNYAEISIDFPRKLSYYNTFINFYFAFHHYHSLKNILNDVVLNRIKEVNILMNTLAVSI